VGELTGVMTINEFYKLIPSLCRCDTSFDPDEWHNRNPLWGHCAVVVLLAQDIFDGNLVCLCIPSGVHFLNEIFLDDNGYRVWVDFTQDQFGDDIPVFSSSLHVERGLLFGDGDTRERYELLKSRFIARCVSCGRL